MTQESILVDGLICKPKNPKLPDFYLGHLAIKVEQFKEFLDQHNNNGWVNVDIMRSKGGNTYARLNTYKQKEKEINLEDIPM